jgi:hypothetical protein
MEIGKGPGNLKREILISMRGHIVGFNEMVLLDALIGLREPHPCNPLVLVLYPEHQDIPV